MSTPKLEIPDLNSVSMACVAGKSQSGVGFMRRHIHRSVVLFCLATVAFGGMPARAEESRPSSSQTTLDDFKRAIREQYDYKEKAFAAGDIESLLMNFYSSDAVGVAEGEPSTRVGRDEFRIGYIVFRKDVSSLQIESVHSVVNGNSGWDWANMRITPSAEAGARPEPATARILFLWSKEGGRWVCKGEVYLNGEFPASLQAPAASRPAS